MTRDVVIGLDLATRSGWAVVDLGGSRLASGVWTLAPRKGRPKADRWVRFSRALSELLRVYEGRIAVVALERPFEGAARHGAKHAAATPTVAWGLVALAEHAAEAHGIASVRYPPARVKAAAAKRGNATKRGVAAAMAERFGVELEAGDEADALAVAVTALAWLDHEALACGEVVERRAA